MLKNVLVVVSFEISVAFLMEVNQDGHDFAGTHANGSISRFCCVWKVVLRFEFEGFGEIIDVAE